MVYKQETCPLCGRNLTAIETYPGRGEVYCCHCDLTIGGNDAKTPEELIALLDGSEHRRIKADNAKLRELCRDLFDRLMDKDEHCGECRSQCEHDAWNFGDPKCVYAERVCELKIEVDDA